MPRAVPSADREAARRLRSAARLFAVQALFQMEAAGSDAAEVEAEFAAHRFGAEIEGETWPEADLALFRAVLHGAVAEQARIDRMTDRALVARWPLGRIDPTLRALFRAAGAELVAHDTPPRVTINEYVEVAKAFFPAGREPKLVNAVLDHMAREARPQAFA
jgi:transcription antitermination protein NusB